MTSTSPVEESNRKAYVVGQWEAGTQVYRSRERSMIWDDPRSPTGRLTLWDSGKLGLGVQIWDGWCCERTLDKLPTDV